MYKSHMKAGNPFQQINLRVINRTDSTVGLGEVCAFALNADAPTATGGELGGGPGKPTGTGTLAAPAPYGLPDNLFANIDRCTNPANSVAQIACVVVDLLDGAGADGTEVVVCLQGVCDVDLVSGNYDVGDVLMLASDVATTFELAAYATADGQNPVAICLTETDSIETATVLFFGMRAFGAGNNVA